MTRTMNTLELRWKNGTWVYDDAEVGVAAEPFVVGADVMMTALRRLHVGPGHDPFKITFSALPITGAVVATRQEEASGGAWYAAVIGGRTMEGWLCPHLFDYFEEAPETIYVLASETDGERITADDLAEALDDLLAAVPPLHSYPHEVEAWEQAQAKAAALLARYRSEAE